MTTFNIITNLGCGLIVLLLSGSVTLAASAVVTYFLIDGVIDHVRH